MASEKKSRLRPIFQPSRYSPEGEFSAFFRGAMEYGLVILLGVGLYYIIMYYTDKDSKKTTIIP